MKIEMEMSIGMETSMLIDHHLNEFMNQILYFVLYMLDFLISRNNLVCIY